MKAIRNFKELMKILLKDTVDVVMLLLWAALCVFFFVKGTQYGNSDLVALQKAGEWMDYAGAGIGFFWLYGFTSILRLAWYKLTYEVKKDEKQGSATSK